MIWAELYLFLCQIDAILVDSSLVSKLAPRTDYLKLRLPTGSQSLESDYDGTLNGTYRTGQSFDTCCGGQLRDVAGNSL